MLEEADAFTVVILAGGKASRMGANKALLEVGNRRLIEKQVEILRALCREVIIVTNEPGLYNFLGLREIPDIIPGQGPLSGIHAGLRASSYPYAFVVACDMPFLEKKLVQIMLDLAPGYDAVVPREGEYLQPLHAVYGKSCLPSVEECLHSGVRRITAFYSKIKVRYLEKNELLSFADIQRVFYNINTPQDFLVAREIDGNNQVLPEGTRAGEKEGVVLPPVLSIVGRSDSGKTTLLEKLLPELKKRGYKVATIKHDTHGFDIDHPGKDSWRHAQAGADAVVISSPDKLALVARVKKEKTIEEIVELLPDIDLVLTEGYKQGDRPKIEVYRHSLGTGLLCQPHELLAVASEIPLQVPGVPCLDWNDAPGLADLIEEKYLRQLSLKRQ